MAMSPGASKRQKELARKERQREKVAKRERRKQEKLERSQQPVAPGGDPEQAEIVPDPRQLAP
jgi:hypothetical protein